jgi:hypothetical protein
MKNLLLMLVSCIGIACQQGSGGNNSDDDIPDYEIRGAYSMIRQVGNNGLQDTLLKKEQLKIFSDRYMMYASPRATDSFGEYGIATYDVKGDTVVENIFYTSVDGQVSDTARLGITNMPNGYRQVIKYVDSTSTFILTEDYDKVGNEPHTPLDGAWKQTKDIFIDPKGDTTRNTTKTQFKIYESGYFIWANPNKDPASNNFYSAYGYGTFKMLDSNKSEETNINSTFYSSLVGKPVPIELEFMNKDRYKQTIVGPDGERSIEIYERLK